MRPMNSLSLPIKANKLIKDIKRLGKLGEISSLEIELSYIEYTDEIISYCQGKGGLIISFNTIYVNYPELGNDLNEIIFHLILYSGEVDIIEGILINMQIQMLQRKIDIAVEIDTNTEFPQLISVSEPSQFLNIQQYIRYRWYALDIVK